MRSGCARNLLLELISRKEVILTSAPILIELGRFPNRAASDTMILETAVTGEADFLCTLDDRAMLQRLTS